MARCEVCVHHCEIAEGSFGMCMARSCRDGVVVCDNYGKVTSAALDPIEKKPLNRFYPGSYVLSLGSYGCNLRCPFCQNSDISYGEPVQQMMCGLGVERYAPEEIAELAEQLQSKGNIGVAYTYNEPLVGYEYVRDTAKLVHERGMKNVLVSNGMVELPILYEILPYMDAMNIDLKAFTDRFYKELIKGSRQMVMEFIQEASAKCHMEVTMLVIPGENDTEEEMRELSGWLASLHNGRGVDIPLHVSRFFPRFHMQDRGATPVETVYRLAEVARENLRYVYTGNC